MATVAHPIKAPFTGALVFLNPKFSVVAYSFSQQFQYLSSMVFFYS
jgi:hypothetical protein